MASTQILEIRVHKATGLRDVAWFGMNQDPYVTARVVPSGKEVITILLQINYRKLYVQLRFS